jgi:hypothetical protein
MQLNQTTHNRQTEPEPGVPTCGLALPKALEDVGQEVGADPHPGVDDVSPTVVAFENAQIAGDRWSHHVRRGASFILAHPNGRAAAAECSARAEGWPRRSRCVHGQKTAGAAVSAAPRGAHQTFIVSTDITEVLAAVGLTAAARPTFTLSAP